MHLRASVSIEATLIMSVVISVIFFVLSIGFYQYDKAVVTEKTFLSARTMSMDEGSSADVRNECFFAENITQNNAMHNTYAEAEATAISKVMFMKRALRISVNQHYYKCYAPELIRKLDMLKRLKNAVCG